MFQINHHSVESHIVASSAVINWRLLMFIKLWSVNTILQWDWHSVLKAVSIGRHFIKNNFKIFRKKKSILKMAASPALSPPLNVSPLIRVSTYRMYQKKVCYSFFIRSSAEFWWVMHGSYVILVESHVVDSIQ